MRMSPLTWGRELKLSMRLIKKMVDRRPLRGGVN